MQPTSLNFAAFLIISLVIYYMIPKRIQNYWLTLINLFYVSSFGLLSVIYLFVVSLVVYILGLRLSKTKRKKQNSELLIAIVVLAAGLVIFKYYKLIFPFFHFSWLTPLASPFIPLKQSAIVLKLLKKGWTQKPVI